jgi:hypothetical protein
MRAHVIGCTKALSVPVDLCECGGREFSPSDHPTPETAIRELIEKWREEADGVTAMGYSQQGDRMRDCANELEALLAHPMGQQKEQDQGSCPASTQGVIAHVERQAADAPVTEE